MNASPFSRETLDNNEIFTILNQGLFGDLVKVSCTLDENEQSSQLYLKTIKINPSETKFIQGLKNEIGFLERISSQNVKPKCIPKIIGSIYEDCTNCKTVFNIGFESYSNLCCLNSVVNEFKEENHKTYERLFKIFDSLVNAFCFLQINGVCQRELVLKNIFLDEKTQNLILFDFGLEQNVDIQWRKIVELPKDLFSTENLIYLSPEKRKNIENDNDFSVKNYYASDSFCFGLIFLELWTSLILDNKTDKEENDLILLLLKVEIATKIIKKEKDRRKMEKIYKILSKCFKRDSEERWDFLKIFKENIDHIDNKKMRLHIMAEEQESVEELDELFAKSTKKTSFKTN